MKKKGSLYEISPHFDKYMLIGIDASRAFLKRRTGIEEYAYQVIKHLRTEFQSDVEVVLYVRKKWEMGNGKWEIRTPEIDFALPKHWRVRALWAPRFWTQIALSYEMLLHSVDVLFVPAHTVPIIHSKKTVVTIHGLEYEFCPEAYSWWERLYMRVSIRYSCKVASTVICVSENTKQDVMKLYKIPEKKIAVISEGFSRPSFIAHPSSLIPYLLFIGRLEERKNVVRMIEAFEMLKEQYQIPHALVLVGKSGYGYTKIKNQITNSNFTSTIIEKGYVNEREKWELLQNADVFLFPTLYEGFGIPVLEAQSVGVPVVTSHTSSLPEVAGEGAIYVDPLSVESIAEGVYRVLSDEGVRSDIIKEATHNVNRFGWVFCAQKIASLLVK